MDATPGQDARRAARLTLHLDRQRVSAGSLDDPHRLYQKHRPPTRKKLEKLLKKGLTITQICV